MRPKVTVSELDQERHRVVRLLLGVAVGRLVEFLLPFARLHVGRPFANVKHDGACNTKRAPGEWKVWDCGVVGRARRRRHLRLIPQSSMALLNRADRERGERVGRPGQRRACALNAAMRALVHYLLYYTGGLHYLWLIYVCEAIVGKRRGWIRPSARSASLINDWSIGRLGGAVNHYLDYFESWAPAVRGRHLDHVSTFIECFTANSRDTFVGPIWLAFLFWMSFICYC